MPFKDKETRNKYARKVNAAKAARFKSAGACLRCGLPCKPFVLCFKHRIYHAKRCRQDYRRKKLEKSRMKMIQVRNHWLFTDKYGQTWRLTATCVKLDPFRIELESQGWSDLLDSPSKINTPSDLDSTGTIKSL